MRLYSVLTRNFYMEHFALARVLKFLPGIIIGLTVHEFSHAFVAHRCGDSTSKDQGRISLNPLRHIDPLGFFMIIIAGFGWAKPVQFNEQNLRNPARDIMKIAVAGPLSNALMAMVLSVIFATISSFQPAYPGSGIRIMNEVFLYAIYINWGLFIFNLIPLPPLDGSHLLLNQFRKFPLLHQALYRYGTFILLGLIVVTAFTELNLFPIWPLIRFLGEGFLSVVGYS